MDHSYTPEFQPERENLSKQQYFYHVAIRRIKQMSDDSIRNTDRNQQILQNGQRDSHPSSWIETYTLPVVSLALAGVHRFFIPSIGQRACTVCR